ncbi:MAG TPA: hypothetical protein QF361_00830 [Gammaproteobacteria bacterium]|nr:hypothetical protein [Gammaproteobacteria bacterium]
MPVLARAIVPVANAPLAAAARRWVRRVRRRHNPGAPRLATGASLTSMSHFVGGEKGGVGKCVLARLLSQHGSTGAASACRR